jgi:SAM-dependent methyltransferase
VRCEADRGRDYWTPRRARLFSQAVQLSDFPARVIKALEPVLGECSSVLDVGAGVGALTVPLAKHVAQVTALEPSPAMLEELRVNLARNHLSNVACRQAAWGEAEVLPHDLILVANVAPIFKDLLGFLTTAEPLARNAIALVQNVGSGAEKFYLGELYPLLLGRPYPHREDYLHTLTLLHGLGIYANARIVGYQFDQPFTTAQDAVDFWTDQMQLTEPDQRRKLVGFLQAKLQPVGSHLVAPMRRQSAVIWWRVAPKDSI